MGMSIDKAISELEILKKNTFSYMSAHQAFITANDTMRKYQKLQADYESRLKADMVAMLTELYMEIEELDTPPDFDSYDAGIVDCEGLIQEKINALKENKE